MSRLFRRSAVFAIALGLSLLGSAQAKEEAFDVVVIGAGISGLSAANRLHAKGYRVVVLEAKDRIGGRMWTSRAWPDGPVELGASWIHEVKNNPVKKLADGLGIATKRTDYDSFALHLPDGSRASAEAADAVFARYAAFRKFIHEKIGEAGPGSTLAEAMDRYTLQEGFDEKQIREFHYSIKTELSDDLAGDPQELSLAFADADVMYRDDVLVLEGYDGIIRHLAEGLDIRLQTAVKAVRYEEAGVRVEAENGRVFEARRALSTLPLGVLKAGSVAFEPPLPARKREAIARLGVGAFSITHLRFPKVFWDDQAQFIGQIPSSTNEPVTILNRHFFTGAPVLTVLNSGSGAKRWETMPDADVTAEILQVLRRLYGPDIPQPESMLRWNWGTDPFARGSYSFGAAGSTPEDRDALAEPVSDRLFFAGEATAPGWKMPTVQGAYLTGLREAKNIDRSLKGGADSPWESLAETVGLGRFWENGE